ncbi:MAG: heavy-metal-associated domain-containing protein [Patescibacteria group bacterium]
MKRIFSVPDIHCGSCVMLLETLEEDYDGISNVKVDLIKKEATIDFDESTISPEAIIKAIKKTTNYEAVLNAA